MKIKLPPEFQQQPTDRNVQPGIWRGFTALMASLFKLVMVSTVAAAILASAVLPVIIIIHFVVKYW